MLNRCPGRLLRHLRKPRFALPLTSMALHTLGRAAHFFDVAKAIGICVAIKDNGCLNGD